jgi:hypothetical protein
VAALLGAFVFLTPRNAEALTYTVAGSNCPFGTIAATVTSSAATAFGDFTTACQALSTGACLTFTAVTSDPGTVGSSFIGTFHLINGPACGGASSNPSYGGTISASSGGTCATPAGNYNVLTKGVPAAAGSTVCGADNCTYTYGPTSSFRSVIGCGGACMYQTGSTTGGSGAYCSGTPTQVVTQQPIDNGVPNTSCQLLGTATVCAQQAATGTYCGTYNGDQVCIGTIPAGTCSVYSSGGVACTVAGTGSPATPPAPNNGTAGTPATPDLTVSSNASGTTTTTTYYSSGKTAVSTVPTNGAGNGVTENKNGTATGTGTGTGTSGTGTGDCVLAAGETGANDPSTCSGTTPSLTRSDTVQSNIQGLYTGIAASPIVAAMTAITTSMPAAGSCPTASVTLTSLTSHSYDFMSSACTVFAFNLGTLISISDAIWCLLGVLIVMSA